MQDWVYKFVLTLLGVALFAYIDGVRGIVSVAACICGGTAFTVSELTTPWLGGGFTMYFISAVATCFLAEIGARILRVPVTVILMPAIIPLVPGALLYNAMKSLMLGYSDWYVKYGKEAIGATAGVGVAIVSVSAAARTAYASIFKIIRTIRKPSHGE